MSASFRVESLYRIVVIVLYSQQVQTIMPTVLVTGPTVTQNARYFVLVGGHDNRRFSSHLPTEASGWVGVTKKTHTH